MKLLNSKKFGLFRIAAADRNKLQELLFKRYPRREWGSFFRFGYRLTAWGIHISFVEMLEPQLGDLKDESGIVEFRANYILRAQMALEETKLGIGVIHSHSESSSTFASWLDNDMDGYFSHEFATCAAMTVPTLVCVFQNRLMAVLGLAGKPGSMANGFP